MTLPTITLPVPPPRYDVADQAQVRRLIELALRLGTGSSGGAATGGLSSRETVQKTTASLAPAASESGTVDMGASSGMLLKVATDRACRLRLYVNSAARAADAGRGEGTDPPPGKGIIAEFIFTASGTIECGPVPMFYNNDGTLDTVIYYAVTNKSASTGTITFDLVHVDLEA